MILHASYTSFTMIDVDNDIHGGHLLGFKPYPPVILDVHSYRNQSLIHSETIFKWWMFGCFMTGWTPLKNDGVHQLGWWYSQYMEIKHVPNHQSDDVLWCFMGFPLVYVSLHRYLWSIDIGQLAPLLERWNPQSGCPNLGCCQATHSASWARYMLLASPLTLGPPAIQINPQWRFWILESY